MNIARRNPQFAALVVCAGLFLSGCQALQFYPQAVWGQMRLLQQRAPVERLLADPELASDTRARLEVAREILAYGAQMGLNGDGRYESYVALKRPYVVWNVFVAPLYSLAAEQWCYPIVGCAPYRGFFSESAAVKFAAGYSRRGFVTYVGGVPAYSTLGWFSDPLLSTFVHWQDGALASLLLHELAHSKVWVKGEVAFNESFASFVGQRGAEAWLRSSGRDSKQWSQDRLTWQRMRGFLRMARLSIEAVYMQLADATETRKLQGKESAYATVQRCYQANRDRLGDGRYDELMKQLDNAYLVSMGVYDDYVPAFAALYAQHESWPAFFSAVADLADQPPALRKARLAALSREQRVRTQSDHDGADDINCEALAGHGFHREHTG